MARTSSDADTPALPEILRSEQLARILVPVVDEMCAEAAARFEAQHLGRYMAEPLSAVRAMLREIRRFHGLAAVLPSDDAHPASAGNGSAPEPAEVTS